MTTTTGESAASASMPLDVWEFGTLGADAPRAEHLTTVRLPHDAMIGERRGEDSPGGADTGWFAGGRYEYRTTWQADSAHRDGSVSLRFEGVQGESTVFVNDTGVGVVRSGYFETELPIHEHLIWDAVNSVRVVVDNSSQPAGRWYPGSGLYRPVHIVIRPDAHIASDGVRVSTKLAAAGGAVVTIAVRLAMDVDDVDIVAELFDDGQLVASTWAPGPQATLQLPVPNARLWSADDPHLYELVTRVESGGRLLDSRRERIGLRTIEVDARRGLRINGAPVSLRGACIHHDNGILGAATHRAAEFRRVRILKQSGFNAIRSAHNPMSRHLLDACDELGMYVLDELADYWFVSKSRFDGAHRFLDTWREDAASLIEKDRNRPSVIMYAIGNEIPETATPEGVALAAQLTDFFHEHDPERPVTLATNLFLNTIVSFNASPYQKSEGEASMAGSTEANVMINHIGRLMSLASRLPRADKASRDGFAKVDVAGYNYGLARYPGDVRRYPDRVILGTETLPGDVARAWKLVEQHPAVIGDFVWAGWEYLGEAGVAVWVPGKRAGLSKPYPYLIAGPGMIDLTGEPDASLRLAQAAWGMLETPAIAVRPLDRSGVRMVRSAWRTTDAVESWSWRGSEGRRAEIEVYSADDAVELVLNGRSLGTRKAGERNGYVARFITRYEPGELTAIGYRDGRPVSESTLRSAGAELGLKLTSPALTLEADGADLAFVSIDIADAEGVREMLSDQRVTLSVDGPAELIGFGTAAPATVESFTGDQHTTFRGHALAILRSTGEPGVVTIAAQADMGGRAVHTQLELTATAPALTASR